MALPQLCERSLGVCPLYRVPGGLALPPTRPRPHISEQPAAPTGAWEGRAGRAGGATPTVRHLPGWRGSGCWEGDLWEVQRPRSTRRRAGEGLGRGQGRPGGPPGHIEAASAGRRPSLPAAPGGPAVSEETERWRGSSGWESLGAGTAGPPEPSPDGQVVEGGRGSHRAGRRKASAGTTAHAAHGSPPGGMRGRRSGLWSSAAAPQRSPQEQNPFHQPHGWPSRQLRVRWSRRARLPTTGPAVLRPPPPARPRGRLAGHGLPPPGQLRPLPEPRLCRTFPWGSRGRQPGTLRLSQMFGEGPAAPLLP